MASDRQLELRETVPLSPEAAAAPIAPRAGDDVGSPELTGAALDIRLQRAGHAREAAGATRYELRGLEGMGATSRVYRVFDRDLAREVAIKVLARSGPGDGEEVESFIDEARITAELQHPNVLPVYELDASERGELFFSMKRIEGRSLGGLLADGADGRADPRFAGAGAANAVVSVFIDVCQALSYAHHRGIVHQDVKPDNVMLGDFGEVLLVDWGSAVRVDDPRPRIYGTPLYMSPEQARRERVTPACDIFCVGASLFHALVGRPPTWADSFEDMLRRRAAGEIDPPTAEEKARAPAPLLHVALKAIAREPRDRYPTIDALLADLEAFQAGLAVSAYAEPPWRRAWRWYLRHRRACWAGAAAAAVVGCLGIALVDERASLARERAKQQSSWAPVYEEDFSRATADDLQRRWVGRVKMADTQKVDWREEPLGNTAYWRLDGGKLTLSSDADYVDLAWRGGLAGDFRVEWDYTPERINSNLDCFIGPERESGYTFHVGNIDPREVKLTRGRDACVIRQLDEPLRLNRSYAFAMEREGSRIRLEIDGKPILDYTEIDPLRMVHTDAFGFDCYRGRTQSIRRVRIHDRPLPELVSPLTVAQALYQSGNPAEAIRRYAEIERARRDTPLAITAGGLRALCLLRADPAQGGNAAEGEALLNDFVRDHGDDQLALIAMVELESCARRSREADAPSRVAALRERLKRWRGQPILQRVVQDAAAKYGGLLSSHQITEVGGNLYDADLGDRLTLAMREVAALADGYGVPTEAISFLHDGAKILGTLGRFDDAAELCPPGAAEQAQLLMGAGDFRGALERYSYFPDVRATALAELGRDEELAGDDGLPADDRAAALVRLGRAEEAVKRMPRARASGDWLLQQGRFDDFATLVAGHEREGEVWLPWNTARYRLLRAKGDFDTILAEYTDPVSRADVLYMAGRFDEALVAYASQSWAPYIIATKWLELGEDARARAIVAKMANLRWLNHIHEGYTGPLLQAILPALMGDAPRDPGRAMAGILAADRRWFGQRLWHLAAVIAGREDDAAFRAQPRKAKLERDLAFAHTLRDDLLGDRERALAGYRAAAPAPGELWDTGLCAWRIQALSAPDGQR